MPSTRTHRPAPPEEHALAVPSEAEAPLPRYSLPVVATAFAAGLFLGTRPGRHLTRGVLHAGLLLVKPVLVVGGLLKLREVASPPSPNPNPPTP